MTDQGKYARRAPAAEIEERVARKRKALMEKVDAGVNIATKRYLFDCVRRAGSSNDVKRVRSVPRIRTPSV